MLDDIQQNLLNNFGVGNPIQRKCKHRSNQYHWADVPGIDKLKLETEIL